MQPTTQIDRGPYRNLSVSDAAAFLGVSKSWLNRKRLEGGGPTFAKLGRRVVYEFADLVQFLESRKRQSTSAGG